MNVKEKAFTSVRSDEEGIRDQTHDHDHDAVHGQAQTQPTEQSFAPVTTSTEQETAFRQ